LPGIDAFEELLDNALEFCLILLCGGPVTQFVDTLLDLDGHSMRLIAHHEMRNSRIREYGIYCIWRFRGMYRANC
jgi:hypothetical protein